MKSPPDQNMNEPQPDGSSDYIHELADRIAADPFQMSKIIKGKPEPHMWNQSYADFIVAMTRSRAHHSDTEEYKMCMATVRDAWQYMAKEEAVRLFEEHGKYAMEVLDND